MCNDSGCETLVDEVDLLQYDSPGCYLVISLFNFTNYDYQKDSPLGIVKGFGTRAGYG